MSMLRQAARELILNEAERERALRVIPPWPKNSGWGAPDSPRYAGIHFKHSIAASVSVVEEKAMKIDPRLSFAKYYELLDTYKIPRAPTEWKTDPNECTEPGRRRDVSDFMSVLYSRVPGMPRVTCEQYVVFVQRTLIPGEEFSEEEYTVFVGLFLSIVRALDAQIATE
jgi:hypothetical protein